MNILSLALAAAVPAAAIIYASICAVVAHVLTRAQRKNPHDNPEWEGARLDRVNLRGRGSPLWLSAWYLRAAPGARAIVFVHGKDGCRGAELKTSTHALASACMRLGFSVLLLDLRGHGQSDAARMTYGLDEKNDVLGAVDWLLERGHLPGSIGLFGASMGGASAIAAAAEEPAVGAVVSDSSFADFGQMMRARFRSLSGLPGWFLPGTVAFARLLTGHRLQQHRPLEQARRLWGRPLMVVHAQGDPFVPIAHGQALAEAAGAVLWVTGGERHLASYGQHQQRYIQNLTDFFHQHLQGRVHNRLSPAYRLPDELGV